MSPPTLDSDSTPASDLSSAGMNDLTRMMIQDSSHVTFNLGQNIITTTEDRIRLCMIEHLDRVGRRKSWTTPLGIFLTILVVFATTTFKDFMLNADVWEAIFSMGGLISFIWLLGCANDARTDTSIDKIIEEIKNRQNTSERD